MSVQRASVWFRILFCVLCAELAHAITVCDSPGDAKAISETRLRLYSGTTDNYTSIDTFITRPETLAEAISIGKDTVLYIHGFLDNASLQATNAKTMINAYLGRRNVNLLMLDWSNIVISIDYIHVTMQVAALGKKLAESINKLSHLIKADTFHVIGHSLGSHVGAFMARNLNRPLHRLTGLDPAFPLFYPSECHIKATDAEIVVALHTDGGIYGTPFDTAKVDFYPNGGTRPQPGCILVPLDVVCSHVRAITLYAESIINERAFPAHRCSPTRDETFIGPVLYFGDKVSQSATGQYCFSTRAVPPFSKNT